MVGEKSVELELLAATWCRSVRLTRNERTNEQTNERRGCDCCCDCGCDRAPGERQQDRHQALGYDATRGD